MAQIVLSPRERVRLDLICDKIIADLRLVIDDLDPLGLTTAYQRGRVEPS